MKKVLISGGAGFIGKYLCQEFLKDGFEVVCVDNFLTSERKDLEVLLENKNFKLIEKDVTEIEEKDLNDNFEYVLHFASPASPVDYSKYPVETLRVNSIGTENLLKIALERKSIFLFASTSEVYGDPQIPVQNEEYRGNVNPIGLRSVYDEGKRYGEAITMAYFRKYKVNTRIARIFNTYGPGMRIDDGRVIPNFLSQVIEGKPLTIYGDGTQTRSFCYVEDLVRGIKKLLEADYHFPINLGNPEEFTILQLAEKIKEIVGRKIEIVFKPLPPDDPKRRKPDITKAREILRWEPVVSLEEGLRKTIPYFEEKLKGKK